MKIFTVSLLVQAITASASPLSGCRGSGKPTCSGLTSSVGVSTEFTDGGCREIILFFTRGTLEPKNMGLVAGRELSHSLKERYGSVAVATEGVEYGAVAETNLLPDGGDPVGIAELTRLINNATEKCPNSKIVVAGYSQGAAVTHAAVKALPSNIMDRLSAVVTFGDTRNTQDHGRIPNFPANRTLIICNPDDAVCNGSLDIVAAHMDYDRRVPEALCFITKQLQVF